MEITAEDFASFLADRPGEEKSNPAMPNGSWLEIYLKLHAMADDVVVDARHQQAMASWVDADDRVIDIPVSLSLFFEKEQELGSLTAEQAIVWLQKAIEVAKKFTSNNQ